jgi:DNA recombination protein RmuC
MDIGWLVTGIFIGVALTVVVVGLRARYFSGRDAEVERLVGPLADQLARVDRQLVALDQERRETRGRLEQQLRSLAATGERLHKETGALVSALCKPNIRGQWGQMQLRKVVELAGMVRHCDFEEQASIAGQDGALRPDMVVNLPGGKTVVVDAKAPLQGVLDAYEAPDEETRAGHLEAHARLLRRHVKQLADKAYWSGMESAPDFVVLFLPGEYLYGAALDADPELIEDAMARRVLIATPTTLLALLHSVAYGWQQDRVAESAQAICELGRELHGRLARLSALLANLGRRMNSAVGAYNEAVGSYAPARGPRRRERRHRDSGCRPDHCLGPCRQRLWRLVAPAPDHHGRERRIPSFLNSLDRPCVPPGEQVFALMRQGLSCWLARLDLAQSAVRVDLLPH